MNSARRAFTTIELLVVIGIIALLTTITVVSIRSVLVEARVSSATNLVITTLGNARALAMKDNKEVAVIFNVRWDPENQQREQVVELLTIQYSGHSAYVNVEDPNSTDAGGHVDRFEAIPGVPVRALPPGVKIAGPWYSVGFRRGQPGLHRLGHPAELPGGLGRRSLGYGAWSDAGRDVRPVG